VWENHTCRRRKVPSNFPGILFLAFVLLGNFFPEALSAGQASGAEATVARVRYLCAIPLPVKDLEHLTGVRPGASLSPKTIDRAVKLLYLTRKFHRVEVEVTPRPEGAEVEFYLVPRRMIAEIKVRGQRYLARKDILRALQAEGIRPGVAYSGRVKSRIGTILGEFLGERGFPGGEVELEERFHAEEFGLTLVVHVREGDSARVGEVVLTGDIYFPENRVRERLKVRPGDRIDPNRFAERVRKLKRWYRKQGFWEVTVDDPEITFSEDPGNAKVALAVWAGRKIRIDFVGPTLHEKEIRDLRRMTRLGEDEEFSLGWVEEKSKNIEDLYRKRGRMFVDVNIEPEDLSQRERVFHFRVEKGPTIYVENISFRGNRTIGDGTLQDQMLTNTRDLLGHIYERHNGIFLEEIFEEDLKAVLFLYRKRGFSQARIEKVDRDILRPEEEEKDGALALAIHVDEGVRSRVGEVVFTGNRVLSGEDISRIVTVKVGGYLDPTEIEEGRKALIEWYVLSGFPNIRIDTRIDFTSDRESALVTYFIEEGMQVRLGEIIVSGTRWTRDYVIQREFRMKEGDVFDIEKVVEGRRRLFRLGFLREVQAEPPLREIGADRWDLLVRVREVKGGAFEMGGGYATEEGLRVFTGLQHQNLAGTGRGAMARAEGRFGLLDWPQDFFEQENYELTGLKFDLGYREPWIFGRDFLGKFDFVNEYQDREETDYEFDLYTNTALFGVEREFSKYVKGQFGYEIEFKRRGYPAEILPEERDEPESEWIGTVTPILDVDKRDDLFNPTRGMHFNTKVNFSHPWLASDRAFVKVDWGGGLYQKLVGRFVGAVYLRTGYGFGLGSDQDIPQEDKFLLGGINSIRGFTQDEVGPFEIVPEDGEEVQRPLGGKVLFNYQVEMRCPFPWSKKLGWVVFTDGGGLWGEPEDLDWTGIRNSAGLGLRYYTPIGPIRFDWGYKLDKEPDEPASEYHLAIGNPF